MTRLLAAATFALSLGAAGPCFAFEREVNNVWWALFDNYNGSGRTACIAENYNDQPVDAVFDIFPATRDFDGAPAPTRMMVTLTPHQTIKVWSFANAPGPGPRCDMRTSITHVAEPEG